MTEIENKEKFLLQHFHEFYVRLEELKTMAKTGNWVFSDEVKKEVQQSKDDDSKLSSNQVHQELTSMFERQQITAGKSGGEMGDTLYKDALFIMAAIADEVFLTMSWAGQEAWSRFLLETKFFGSNAGGDIFFLKLDSLLKERNSVYTEIAIMSLLALSLGFRGKYHGVNDAGAIEKYKDRLYHFIFQNPPDLNKMEKKLFPDSYMHTLERDPKTVIPGLKKWYSFVALLAVSLLGISHVIWMQMTGDISKTVSQILGG